MSKVSGLISTIKIMLIAMAAGGVFYLIVINLSESSYSHTITVFNAIKYIGCASFFIFFKPLMNHFLNGKDNLTEYKNDMIKVRNKMVILFISLEVLTFLFSKAGEL